LLLDEYDQSMNARITVSLPEELVAAANAAVAAGRAPSVSAFVADAMKERVGRESVADVLAEWRAEAGPLDDEDEAWVREALSRARVVP
jgi:Arc/MetJ-type ribon-helix-helix transcriptional regulator